MIIVNSPRRMMICLGPARVNLWFMVTEDGESLSFQDLRSV